MLEELDSVNWHDLGHAYGPADDVPGLLRDLMSPEEETRDRAHDRLYGNLYHQGTVYDATAFAIPFLLELAEQESVPDRRWILQYLADIAQSFLDLNSYDPAAIEMRLPWAVDAEQAHDAVRKGIPVYVRLLSHPDARVRMGAASPLARLPEASDVCLPALEQRLTVEENQWVRARLYFGQVDLLLKPDARRELLAGAFSKEPCEGARLQLAMRLVEDFANDAPREALACLIAGIPDIVEWGREMDHSPRLERELAEIASASSMEDPTGHEPKVDREKSAARAREVFSDMARMNALSTVYPNIENVSDGLKKIEPQRIQAAVQPLLDAFRALEAMPAPLYFVSKKLAETLIHISFDIDGQAAPASEHDLTLEQHEVLAAVAASDTLWRGSGTVQKLLQSTGAPVEREALQRFLTS